MIFLHLTVQLTRAVKTEAISGITHNLSFIIRPVKLTKFPTQSSYIELLFNSICHLRFHLSKPELSGGSWLEDPASDGSFQENRIQLCR